jgi:hypothetical protein
MERPSPQKLIEEFLSRLPSFFQKILQGESLTPEELEEYGAPDSLRGVEAQELTREYERLLQAIPEDYRRYRERKEAVLSHYAPPPAIGRPRKDAEAAEAARLHAEHKSWPQIARAWGTAEEDVAREAERIRNLVKLRKRRSPEKNSS